MTLTWTDRLMREAMDRRNEAILPRVKPRLVLVKRDQRKEPRFGDRLRKSTSALTCSR